MGYNAPVTSQLLIADWRCRERTMNKQWYPAAISVFLAGCGGTSWYPGADDAGPSTFGGAGGIDGGAPSATGGMPMVFYGMRPVGGMTGQGGSAPTGGTSGIVD